MRRPRKKRRQGLGSAWHWKQTESWYDTLPGIALGGAWLHEHRDSFLDPNGPTFGWGRIRGSA